MLAKMVLYKNASLILIVEDTSGLTLKNKISNVLSHHGLDIQNIRGQ
jgi:ribose 5-phosphate isomerase RpiB